MTDVSHEVGDFAPAVCHLFVDIVVSENLVHCISESACISLLGRQFVFHIPFLRTPGTFL
jgi:hypothetical protein